MNVSGLSQDAIRVLAEPVRWNIISGGGISASPRPAGDAPASRRRWLKTHCHRHAHREILVCLNGTGWYGIERSLYAVEPGSVFYIPPGCEHEEGWPPGSPDLEHLWIHLLETRAFYALHRMKDGTYYAPRGGHRMVSYADIGLIRHDWFSVIESTDSESAAWRNVRLHTLLGMLVLNIVEAENTVVESRAGSASLHEQVIDTIVRHIEQTAGRDVSLDSLARLSGYSKFHLHRLFKEFVGMTIHAYIDMCRLKAVRAMSRENRSKKEISAALGFSHPAAFSRWMRNHGVSI